MVGPISGDERRRATTQIKLGFVVLVGLSAGLITLQGDPSPLVMAGAVVAGLVVGAVLVWLVFPGSGSPRSLERRER
ncbi:MAG: hypothetical protein ABEJ31_04660 [Haloarculaceae archaeon]